MAETQCINCDVRFEEFTTYDGRVRNQHKRKACSPVCAMRWDAKIASGRRAKAKLEPREPVYVRDCRVCGTPIYDKKKSVLYCSSRCQGLKALELERRKHLNASLDLVAECACCGTLYCPKLSYDGLSIIGGKNLRSCCSRPCRTKLTRMKRARLDRETPEGVCWECERPYPTYAHTVGVRGGLRLFCSRLCSGRYRYRLAVSNRNNTLAKYGLTNESYDSLLADQGGRCAICGVLPRLRPDGAEIHLHVDHDHYTGATRGLLCPACNVGLGRFDDSIELLRGAIAYLEHHRTPQTVARREAQ